MNNINDIYSSIEFIEANLKNNITVESVAKYTGYSLYYFSRVFNKNTGHSPYEYIIRRRLSQAAIDLVKTNNKIIDIAFEYQFNNPETFTRAFYRMFRYLPSSIKTYNDLANLVLKDKITIKYLYYINKPNLKINKEVIEKNALSVIGIITNNVEHNIIKDQFIYNKINIINPESEYSIYFNPEKYDKGGYILRAYEVTSLEKTPSLFIGKKFPHQKYLKCNIKTKVFKLKYIFQYLYQTVLKSTNINEKTPYAIENNRNFDDKGICSTILYIPINNQATLK